MIRASILLVSMLMTGVAFASQSVECKFSGYDKTIEAYLQDDDAEKLYKRMSTIQQEQNRSEIGDSTKWWCAPNCQPCIDYTVPGKCDVLL